MRKDSNASRNEGAGGVHVTIPSVGVKTMADLHTLSATIAAASLQPQQLDR